MSAPGVTRGWVPAMRLARRTAWRHKARTLLVAALVALPVLGLSTIAIVTRTSELTLDERADRFLGTADAFVDVTSAAVIDPPHPGPYDLNGWTYSGEIVERDPSTVDLMSLLPAGSTVSAAPVDASVTVGTADRLASAQLIGGALDGPLASYRHRLLDGEVATQLGEVVVSTALAERLDLGVGDTLTVTAAPNDGAATADGAASGGVEVTIVGRAVDARYTQAESVYTTRPVAVDLVGPETAAYSSSAGFVELPPGVDTVALWRDLAAQGVAFVPRDAVLHPDRYPAPDPGGSYTSVETLGAAGLVLGFGLLEVVLLAGTAFAVGARRQVRELGLVAANGGERRDVRRIVLAQGVVLGLIGGAAGVALGFLPLLLGWSWLEEQTGHLFGSVVVRPLELLTIAAFGVLAGVLAAVIPARTASNVPVMTALSDRFVTPTKPLRRPLLGVGLIVTGGALSFAAAIRARSMEAAYEEQVAALQLAPNLVSDEVPFPDTRAYVVAAVLGLAVMAAGLLIGSPALVAGVARLGRFLPLLPRLAMRDAGRHRHRTAPAICAIAIAVGGSVAAGVVFSADETETRRTYTPSMPVGWATVYGFNEPGVASGQEERRTDALNRAAELLGADRTVTRQFAVVEATAANMPAGAPAMEGWVETLSVASDCASASACPNGPAIGEVVIGGADLVATLTGRPADAAAETMLAGGGAVVLQRAASISDGRVRLGTYSSLQADADPTGPQPDELSYDEGGGLAYRAELPAVAAYAMDGWSMPAAVISAETASALGLVTQATGALLTNDTVPTEEQADQARAVLTNALMDLQVERGYQSSTTLFLLVLTGASALVTVASVAIAVGLAAAEGRADLATLAAVGADPRRRRVLAMCQAAVVGLVGCLLGVAFGLFVAALGLEGFGLAPWSVPWALLGGIGFAVPLLAVLVAGLFTRARLPLVRRLAA